MLVCRDHGYSSNTHLPTGVGVGGASMYTSVLVVVLKMYKGRSALMY